MKDESDTVNSPECQGVKVLVCHVGSVHEMWVCKSVRVEGCQSKNRRVSPVDSRPSTN